MTQQPELTPKQQALMDFLDRLATETLSNEALSEGYALLDAAAAECRQLQQEIAQQQQRGGCDAA